MDAGCPGLKHQGLCRCSVFVAKTFKISVDGGCQGLKHLRSVLMQGVKDYAEQQKRLLGDITTYMTRNRNIARQREEDEQDHEAAAAGNSCDDMPTALVTEDNLAAVSQVETSSDSTLTQPIMAAIVNTDEGQEPGGTDVEAVIISLDEEALNLMQKENPRRSPTRLSLNLPLTTR